MLAAQRSGQAGPNFFRGGSRFGGRNYTARMAVLPVSGNENGCFTVGVARNYDQVLRLFQSAAAQMVLSSVVIMAGAGALVLSLMRARRCHRQRLKSIGMLTDLRHCP